MNKQLISSFKKHPGIGILFICIAVSFLSYLNALHGEFLGDDYWRIQDIQKYFHLGLIDTISHTMPDRPILMISIWLNALFSGTDPYGYKITNIFIHSLVGFVLYFVINKLHSLHTPAEKPIPILSLFVVVLFLIHPINNQSINIIIQRGCALATLFALLSFYFFIILVPEKNKQMKTKYYLISLVCFVISIFSKQITFTFPLFLTLYWWVYLKNKLQFKKFIKYLIPFLCILSLPIFIYLNLKVNDQSFVDTQKWYNYFTLQWRVLFIYFKLFFIPYPLKYSYFISENTSLVYWKNFLPLLGHILILFLTVKYLRKNKKLLCLGILGMYIFFLSESGLFPIRHIMFEHRTYLPFSWLMISVFSICKDLNKKYLKRFIYAPFLLVFLIFIGINVKRNDEIHYFLDWQELNIKDNPTIHTSNVFFLNNLLRLGLNEKGKHYSQFLTEIHQGHEWYPLYLDMFNFEIKSKEEKMKVLEKIGLILVNPSKLPLHVPTREIFNEFIKMQLIKLVNRNTYLNSLERLLIPQISAYAKNPQEMGGLLKIYLPVLKEIKEDLEKNQRSKKLSQKDLKHLDWINKFILKNYSQH